MKESKNGRRVEYEDKDYARVPLEHTLSMVRGGPVLMIIQKDIDDLEEFLRNVQRTLPEHTNRAQYFLDRIDLAKHAYTERKPKTNVPINSGQTTPTEG